MSTDEAIEDSGGSVLEAGVRYYLFLGLAGLLMLWLLLTPKFELFALVPVLLGALGMAGYLVPTNLGIISRGFRKPLFLMPILVLISLIVFEALYGYPPWDSRGAFEFNDLLIGAALLAYFISQYRLFSLGTAVVPADPRPRPDRGEGDQPDPRPARTVAAGELISVAIVLGICVLLGQLLWLFVTAEWEVADSPQLYLPRVPWRMTLLIWLVGVGTIVLMGIFRLLRVYRMAADEARMVLQDELWSETRGEQRRSARWLAWTYRQLLRRRRNEL